MRARAELHLIVAGLAAMVLACGNSGTTGSGDASADSTNPPGCPSSPPGGGGGCSPSGLQCSYCGISAACTNGTWRVIEFACGGAEASVPVTCGTSACTNGQVCVREQTVGGAIIRPDDAGMCPNGRVLDPQGYCDQAPSYQCAQAPSACATGLTCSCAQPLCADAGSGFDCVDASAGVVDCIQAVP